MTRTVWVRVQRLAGETSVSYTVIGGDSLPVPPIEAFLVHLVAKGRSPATVKAYAHDLRDLFEWLGHGSGAADLVDGVTCGFAASRAGCGEFVPRKANDESAL